MWKTRWLSLRPAGSPEAFPFSAIACLRLPSQPVSWAALAGHIGRVFLTGATSEDLTLSVSIVVLFTLVFQFVQPYLALAVGMSHLTLTLALGLTLTIPNPNPDQVGMSHDVAGAWIGASVDQTGNDIYSKW